MHAIDPIDPIAIIDALTDEALTAAVVAVKPPSATADVSWRNDHDETWTLTGHAARIGARVVAWTSCDEAGSDDYAVFRTDVVDLRQIARDHAKDIAGGLGEIV